MSKIFRANPNCCPKCSEIDGKEYADSAELYDVSHPNCKCELEDSETGTKVKMADLFPEKTKPGPVPKLGGGVVAAVFDDTEEEEEEEERRRREARKKKTVQNQNPDEDLENIALNDPIQEEFYTGFVYVNPPDGKIPDTTVETTYDFGSTLVQVAPVGSFVGSDREGKPVKEEVTIESLKHVAEGINEEILVDIDHASEQGGTTEAAAWASDFMVVEGLGNNDGLYARLKWTKKGRELVEDRTYRFLSPVWEMADETPVRLKSIALTNRPALKGISPIINQEPRQFTHEGNIMDKEILELAGIQPVGEHVSDEEKAQVLETVRKWKETAEKVESDKKEDELRKAYNECIEGYDVKEDLFEVYKESPELFKKTLNACGRVKNEEPKEEEEKQKEEKEEPEEKETIPLEALNSAPVPEIRSVREKAMDLSGEAFLKFVKEHAKEL